MSEREEWMTLIRNEYDPKPDLGRAAYPAFDSEWDDGAGRIADAILADKCLAGKIVNLINALRLVEGDSVTILCDNPDFNGQPNCAIECCGSWTDWNDRRFTGETIFGALRDAYDAKMAHERA